jgi:4-amino-4-deoxy-L-arabinose transferase-like glycosyltransferase
VALCLSAIASMLLTYRVGRRLFGELTGFVAAVLLGCFYIVPFYGSRIMTEIPHLMLTLVAVDLMVSGKPRALVGSLPALALATLTRFTAALMLPVLAVWAALAARRRVRVLLLSAGLGVLVMLPYLIWATVSYGDPLHAWKVSQYLMGHPDLAARIAGIGSYLEWLWTHLGWFLGVLLGVGLLLSALWVTKPRALLDDEAVALRGGLLLWVWILVPLVYFGAFVHEWQDRFVVLALPPAFLAIGQAVALGAELVAKRRRWAGTAIAMVPMAIGAVGLVGDADTKVREKLDSFYALRDAGVWLRDHTPPETEVVCANAAQLTYYSERATHEFPSDLSALQKMAAEGRAEYMVVSGHAEPPQWLVGMRVAKVAQIGGDRPAAMIFRLAK